jgi:hypothetical protein
VINSWEEWYSGQGTTLLNGVREGKYRFSMAGARLGEGRNLEEGGFQLAGGKVCYCFGSIMNLWIHIIY